MNPEPFDRACKDIGQLAKLEWRKRRANPAIGTLRSQNEETPAEGSPCPIHVELE
jgi:hypothetical protein